MTSGPSPFPPQNQAEISQPPLSSQSEPSIQSFPILTTEGHSHKAYIAIIGTLLIAVIVLGAFVALDRTSNLSFPNTHPNPYSVSTARTSRNWSGFTVCCNASSVTDVIGSWTVPKASCSSQSYSIQSADAWVGIDGALNASNTVEQIGTASRCNPGNSTAVSYAWYEWYPASVRRLLSAVYPIVPGDIVTAEVKWDGSQFIASMTDQSEYWSVERVNSTIASIAPRASAEWILEAPTNLTTLSPIQLANFGKVFFEKCSATVGAGSGPMGTFHLIQDTMVDSNSYTKAVPMLPFYNDGTSFSVWWVSLGP